MPLLGLVDGERVVSTLFTDDEWATLEGDIRSKHRSLALACGYPGHTRVSKLGTRHFAHNPGGDGCSAGESAEHLLAKSVILDAAVAAGWEAEPEARGDGWIADVMATRTDVKAVFEVQWSRQTLANYSMRQRRYLESGIASAAWFARHHDGLPSSDRQLPVFGLTIEDGTPSVAVEETRLPLSEAVRRLLTGGLQHRDYLFGDGAGEADVVVMETSCYRCHATFGVWDVRERIAIGNCGRRAAAPNHREDFPRHRPETHPAVVAAASRAIEMQGTRVGRLGMRTTYASGATYMAFTCPHCDATTGEVFVRQEFTSAGKLKTITCDIPDLVVSFPHWCLASDGGTCRVPTSEERSSTDAQAAQPVAGRVSVRAISAQDAIRTMFRSHRS